MDNACNAMLKCSHWMVEVSELVQEFYYWNSNPLLSTGRSDPLIPLGQTKWLKGDLNYRPIALRANALTN